MSEDSVLNAKSFVELNKENQWLLKLNQELLRENKKLKEQVDFQLIKIAFLSDRIEKAVEYIDFVIPCIHDEELLDDLLEILKGGKD